MVLFDLRICGTVQYTMTRCQGDLHSSLKFLRTFLFRTLRAAGGTFFVNTSCSWVYIKSRETFDTFTVFKNLKKNAKVMRLCGAGDF